MSTTNQVLYTEAPPPTAAQKKATAKQNMLLILMYSLVISASLALNTLMVTLLQKLPHSGKLMAQILYVIILFGIVAIVTYYLNFKLKKVL